MKFSTSCESAFMFDYSVNGNIYYLGPSGELGRINLFYENYWPWWRDKKYSIK